MGDHSTTPAFKSPNPAVRTILPQKQLLQQNNHHLFVQRTRFHTVRLLHESTNTYHGGINFFPFENCFFVRNPPTVKNPQRIGSRSIIIALSYFRETIIATLPSTKSIFIIASSKQNSSGCGVLYPIRFSHKTSKLMTEACLSFPFRLKLE